MCKIDVPVGMGYYEEEPRLINTMRDIMHRISHEKGAQPIPKIPGATLTR